MSASGGKKRQIGYRDFKDRDFLLDTVRRCQNGDTEAMESVYTAYKSSLFNLTFRFTRDILAAEDLLQDIFVKIFTSIKRLKSPEAFNSWLYRIAVNTCMSFARSKKRAKEVSSNEMENIGNRENIEAPVYRQLEQAVKNLPPKQKAVFQLHDVEGFTHTEIARIMKITEGTAKSQLFKARMRIRDYLRSA